MKRVLLVSGSYSESKLITCFLQKLGYKNIIMVKGCNSARCMINYYKFELVVINTPLNDEFGKEFAVTVAEKTISGIILISESNISEDLFEKLSCFGIFVLSKPLNFTAFSQTLNIITSSYISGINIEMKLINKTEEIKLINKAKNYLIQNLNLSEPQAHRFIEKHAMDTRQTRKEIAKNIIFTYDN